MLKPFFPRPLTRAAFLKLTAGIVGAGAAAYLMYELAPWIDANAPAAKVRRPFVGGVAGNPQMREIVRFATLAASGHNAQPWKFVVESNSIKIHPDLARRLPAVDPQDREMWISLGCALENLCLAADKVGRRSEIDYPEANDFIHVNLVPSKPVDGHHFAAIPMRQNTRSEYDGRKLQPAEMSRLMSIPVEPGITVRELNGPSMTEKLLEYVSLGNLNQFDDTAFVEELVHWIRFDKREALSSMDGLYTSCMGSPQVPRWIGQQFVSRTAPANQTESDAKKLRSSAGAIAIASTSDDKVAWVRTGQVYQRLALEMTSMNIKSAFLNQPNEVPAVRKQFQSALEFGHALPQLLLRFGYADPMPSSYRRSVDEVIVLS